LEYSWKILGKFWNILGIFLEYSGKFWKILGLFFGEIDSKVQREKKSL
jgi:hypothetical protein